MMKNSKWFDCASLSRRDILTVLMLSVAFLLFQIWVVGLIPAQIVMVVLFNTMFFAHPWTRKLAVALIPFIFFEISYDWMRLYPNYLVNDVDIEGIYLAERQLFGISYQGAIITPCEWFQAHNSQWADFMAGMFYLCWVPMPIFLALWLYIKGERRMGLRFAMAFLMVNFVGFAGYYIHPAAPPWYAIDYGFTPDFSIGGHVAGLARFDAIVGWPVFQNIYVNNSNIYAAVPSLHAAYVLTATIYAVKSKRSWPLVAVFALITIGVWITAVYTCHHYIIDIILGIVTAFVGIALFEGVIMRWKTFRRFIDKYENYVS